MAGDAKKLQPIIVKRVRRGGHGAHGGAWKIAYADFVTAMMAFFLLMWLLGSTTEGDKKGIADYFGSPLRMALWSSGSGAGDASHVVKGGGQDLTRTTGQVKRGELKAERDTLNVHALKAEQMRAEVTRLHELRERVEQGIAANPALAGVHEQILLDMTQDGLRIQVVDTDGRAMFASGSAVVSATMRELLREVGATLSAVPNRLTLEGHTDALPYGGGAHGYGNWELSSDRANASRRELVAGGLADERVLRVQGLAASQPFVRLDPAAAANRRISIVVMTREAELRALDGSSPAAAAVTPAPPLAATLPAAATDAAAPAR